MYPTLCALCGLEIPAHCEGTSFAPLLDDPEQQWKTAAFSQYPRRGVMGTTIRTDRFRYTEWCDTETGEIRGRELYDHETDPQENVNAAEHAAYKAEAERLHKILEQGWQGAVPDGR